MNPKTGQKKWVITILVAAVLIAAVVAVAIFAGSGPDAPVVETPVDGPETGVYYYDTAEGEYVLTLNSGNRFTIAGPSLNKSGKYVVTENGIELDFVKDEDGTGAITVDGDVMNLQYKDKTMRFLKKVTYAVTFNANGGSEVASINVVNGKTVSKPADPSKEGNVFIGWYADEACTKLYPFGTEVVTANTTVYAKWAETVVGQNEYTVDFDLGYDAEGYAAMATIGGKLYNVPTPERDGYTFGGWWVSMTQKADALTVPYTEEMVFQANTTLFALWQTAPEGGKLEAPMVEVYADSIKWNTVKGASSYELKILNAKGEVVYTEQLGTTTKNYNFNELTAGEYTVEVTALASVEEKNSETTTRTFVNKALDRVSLFTVVDGGILLWNGVEGAEKYLITIDCGNENHKHTAFDNGSSTTFMFAGCDMQEGGIRFTVTAVAEGKASSVSETFVYDRKLDAVGQILYNEETQSFYWDSVSNAAKYLVTVTVGGETYTVDNGSATTFSVKNLSGDIQLAIVPATKGYNSPEAATTTYTKTSLATPEGLAVSGNILSWNAVEGATGYMVKINNQSFPADSNSLDLLGLAVEFDSSTTYNISVMALGTESSLYSDAVTIKYLAEIDNVSYKNNTLTWTPILGVENYEIRVNGGEPITVSGTNSAKVVLTKAGMNLIEVRYSDLGGSKWASTEVFAYAVTYDSRSLNGIVTEYLAMGDTMMLPGEFTQDGYDFTGWYNSPDAANGMGGIYTEKQFAGSGSMVLYGNWTPKTYYVEFVGVEGVTNINKGDKQPVTFHEGYQLPIPENPNAGGDFAGWYTGPGASGTALTDSLGNCITDYTFTRDTVAYPFFDTGVLSYVLQADNTYAVTAGPTIKGVANIRIPEYYKGVPVTVVLENAFFGISTIETLNIPATIKTIGVGAIPTAITLKEINVYTETVQQNYEIFYSSHDGVLLRHDMGTTYLENVPRGKTGEYTIPDEVNVIRDNAFRYSNITKLTVGSGVTFISRRAFYNCTALETLEFKTGGTAALTIDPEAFYRTANVTTLRLPARLAETDLQILNQFAKLATLEVEAGGINYGSVDNMITNGAGTAILYAPLSASGEFEIPKGIREIGPMAFADRPNLTKVIIPNYVNSIGSAAFRNCTGITEVIVNGSRSNDLTIGTNAFTGCKELTSVTFLGNGTATPDTGAISIGTGAFSGNPKLRELVYENGSNVATIGSQAFANCTMLTEAYIPATVTSIGNSAFSGCSNIETVEFAPNGQEIGFGSNVFAGCVKLTTVNLPATITQFEGGVFSGCDALREVVVDPANEHFVSYEGALYTKDYSKLLFYPKALDGDLSKLHPELKRIGANVFQRNPKLVNVTISKNITYIDAYAFEDCYNMTSITFEAGGTGMIIGNNAFASCDALKTIELPAYTTSIGASAFEGTPLTAFTIPEAVTSLGAKALKGTKITTIHIPANVTSIGSAAFQNCSSMTSITFAEGTKPLTIGTANDSSSTGVFIGTKIKDFTIGNRVTVLGAYAFYNQTALTTFTMSEGSQLKELGTYIFSGTTKLTTVTLADGLETIGYCAFYKSYVPAITIPKTVTLLDQYAFYTTSKLKTVTFAPGGTEGLTIKRLAFGSATVLEVLNLPARLETIYTVKSISGATGGFKDINEVFTKSTKLKEINVEEGGQYFASIDGILYEKTNGVIDTLLFAPPAKTGELTIGKEIRVIENGAFVNTQLTKISFEEYAKGDPNYGQPLLEIGRGGANKYSAVSAAYSVFNGKNLQTINLPSHLKKVGARAFGGLTKAGVTINFNMDAHLEKVEGQAFADSTGIVTLHLPVFDSIGLAAFYNMTSVTSITWEEGSQLTEIGEYMFYCCRKLTSFEIPATVTTIGKNAFYQCVALTTLTFEEGSQLTSILDKAFYQAAISEFVMPNSVTLLGFNVFQACKNLKTLTLSERLTNFPETTVLECTALEAIHVSQTSSYFTSIDGVLYDLAKTILYRFPAGKDPTGFQIPEGVTAIAPYAMEYFGGETIVLPECLETIGDAAFMNSMLIHIRIPKNVTTIGEAAFLGYDINGNFLSKLQSVEFAPDSKLETIGGLAFGGSQIKSIDLPDGVHTIGEEAFTDCKKLEDVVLPAAITELNRYTFNGCTRLKTFVMQEGLGSIGDRALRSNSANTLLTELVIPSTVEYIGESNFANMTALKTVTFAEGSHLTTLGYGVFTNCSSLEGITLPAMLESVMLGEWCLDIGSESYFYEIAELFTNCSSMKYVDMSACVNMTVLPSGMFVGCTGIETLILPPNLETISNWAFSSVKFDGLVGDGLINLKDIVIPASVTSIGGYAFNGCSSLKTVTFESGNAMTQLGAMETNEEDPITGINIFAGTTALETIVLPQDLEKIGIGCFENSGIANISLSSNVTHIGDRAFYNCDNIQEMNLTANLMYLGNEAFFDCNNLVKADLYSGLEYLGARAFGFCSKLAKAYIPDSVTQISGNPFMGCESVASFELDPDNDSFVVKDGVLYDKTMYTVIYYPASLTAESYTFPETVYAIAEGAFAGAQFKSIEFPERFTTIADYAFAASALETFTFHRRITTIGIHAFDGCDKLNNVFLPNTVKNAGHYAFANCTGLTDFVFEDVDEDGTPYNIGTHFFEGCTSITQLILPNQLLPMEDGVANYIAVKNPNACIPAYMFANTGIVNAVIPSRIGDLGTEGVFANCALLETVTFESKQLTGRGIGPKFFANCTKMKEFTLPMGLENVSYGGRVFDGCTALEKVTLYTNCMDVTMYSYTFGNCPNLKTIELLYVVETGYDENGKLFYKEVVPANIYCAYDNAFAGTGMDRLYFRSDHFYIAGPAFNESKVETIVIDSIGWFSLEGNWDYNYGVFTGADALKEVWISLSEEGFYFAENAFVDVDHDINVYFTNFTLEDMIGIIGESYWYDNASEKVHFYFADTMPADVEWPEELQPEE